MVYIQKLITEGKLENSEFIVIKPSKERLQELLHILAAVNVWVRYQDTPGRDGYVTLSAYYIKEPTLDVTKIRALLERKE